MIRAATRLLLLLGVTAYAWSAQEIVVDFENAAPLWRIAKPIVYRDGRKKAWCSPWPGNPSKRRGKAC